MRKTLSFIPLLLAFFCGSLHAADYVDDINSASSAYAAGQRVVYEMNVGMFTDEGTFGAAAGRLGELRSLGVDIVWLMPVYPRGASNSPYAATDLKSTNPRYGTVADLKALVARAHTLGMKVWLDWVPNHTATNATWVTAHPEYYVTQGGQMVHPGNYQDVYQLDYSNSALRDEMNSALKFWIDETDIDGFRCDYVSSPQIPASYWQAAIPMIKSYKSGKDITFLGEADLTDSGNSRLRGCGFDYDYAWSFQSNLASLDNTTYSTRVKLFCDNLAEASKGIAEGRMLYLTNHDQNFNDGGKTLTQMYGDNRYALTVLTFTLNGMPLIYNGQEYGGNQVLDYFSDTKIDRNVTDSKMLNTLRTLAALKHTQRALADGNTGAGVEWIETNNSRNVLAYTRKAGESTVLVVLNFSDKDADVVLTGLEAGKYSRWIDSETIGRGVSRKSVSLNATHSMSIGAKGYAVFVKGEFADEDIAQEPPIGDLTDDDAYSVFYETAEDAVICVWLWNADKSQFTANAWPGDRMTRLGVTAEGNVVYKYTVSVAEGENPPTNLIFTKNGSDDASKTYDGAFVNHGYYVEGEGAPEHTVPTGITAPAATAKSAGTVYTISGMPVKANGRLPKGIYIVNGKKIAVK